MYEDVQEQGMSGKYRKNYEYRDVTDENGKASVQMVYVGTYYYNPMNPREQVLLAKDSLVFSSGCLAAFLVAGLMNSGAGHSFLVTIPYVISFLPTVYFILGASGIRRMGEMLEEEQYEKSIGRTARSSIMTCFFSVVTLLTDLIFMIRSHERIRLPGDLIFPAAMIVMCALSFIFFRRNRKRINSVTKQEQGFKGL